MAPIPPLPGEGVGPDRLRFAGSVRIDACRFGISCPMFCEEPRVGHNLTAKCAKLTLPHAGQAGGFRVRKSG